eukprot:COSAG04_NODE_9971_length_816_cov_0.885635_2_plen_91_part_00
MLGCESAAGNPRVPVQAEWSAERKGRGRESSARKKARKKPRFVTHEVQQTTILRRRSYGGGTEADSVEAIRKANRRTQRKFGVKVSATPC